MNPQYIINNIQNNPGFFKTLSLSQKTKEVCVFAVEMHPANIIYVPNRHRSAELTELAVMKNPEVLGMLPKKDRTHELSWAALREEWRMILHVPDPTIEMVRYVIDYLQIHNIPNLSWFRLIKQTPEIRQTVIERCPVAIRWCKDPAIEDWILACSKDKKFLGYVPPSFRSQVELLVM